MGRRVEMDKRIMGLETEYGICSKLLPKRPESFERAVDEGFNIDNTSNGFLPNGARFYLDTGAHPEYATPECTNPVDVALYDKAGERIVRKHLGKYTLLKNNVAPNLRGRSRGREATFGCHENYMVDKERYMDIVDEIIPFLVTRQIYTGSGSIREGRVELSQRARHINYVTSSESVEEKPIILNRDEPLANRNRYKRLQLLVGDSNMSEIATYLKVGITAMVIRLIEEKHCPKIRLKDPLSSLKSISSDHKYRWITSLEGGKTISAVDVQRKYLRAAHKYFSNDDEITKDLLSRWEYVLDTLAQEPLKLGNSLDWVAKKELADAFIRERGVRYKRIKEELKTLDLRYHDINPQRGLYYLLQKEGGMERLVSDKDIERATETPPADTRAWFRGSVIRKSLEKKGIPIFCDWNRVRVNGFGNVGYLRDPFSNYSRRLEKALAILDKEVGR